MKKNILLFVILISVIFFNINYIKALDVDNTSNNQNTSIGAAEQGSSCFPNGFCGTYLQGIYVRIYNPNGEKIIDGKYFMVFKDGGLPTVDTKNNKKYYLCESKSDNYNVKSYVTTNNSCKEITRSDINKKINNATYIMDGKRLFNFSNGSVVSYGTQFTESLDKSNFANFNKLLNAMGYQNYENKDAQDYMVIEPVLTTIANSNVYIGTVNELIQNNINFRGGAIGADYGIISVYTSIASSYRSVYNGKTSKCMEDEYITKNGKKEKRTRIISGSSYDYSGCGYNKYIISEKTIGECKIKTNVGCLSASVNPSNTCKDTDYTFTYEYNGIPMYCNTSFSLQSNLDGGSSTNPWGPVKSGTAYIGGTKTAQVVSTGTLKINCSLYSKDANKYINVDPFSELKYEDFVNSVKYDVYVNGKAQLLDLYYETNNPKTTHSDVVAYGDTKRIVYSKIYTAHYYTPKATINRTTGLVVYDNNALADETVAATSYGFFSRLEDEAINKMSFKVSLNNKKFGLKTNDSLTSACYYKTSEPTFKDIAFRTIDTNNPFVGENGKGRKTGYNWCDGSDCSSKNQVVIDAIINKNNSYDVLGSGPIYKFVLTPNTIQTIRDSNKKLADTNNTTKCQVNDSSCRQEFFNIISDSIVLGSENLIIQ